jgi:uncharacterized membrane protein YccC
VLPCYSAANKKNMKKAIGYLLIFAFATLVVYAFVQNIINTGWYFILSLVAMIIVFGLFLLGCYLISDNY